MDATQKLEMEIQELKGKLQVMKHLGDADDDAVQQKMKEMNDELEQKVDSLGDLESLNQTLLVKERQSNDELQEARKELIKVLFLYPFLLIFFSSSRYNARHWTRFSIGLGSTGLPMLIDLLLHILQGLSEILNGTAQTIIGTKRMGVIDETAFIEEAKKKFPPGEAEMQGLSMCSFWQKEIENPEWHPLRVVDVEGSGGTVQVKKLILLIRYWN